MPIPKKQWFDKRAEEKRKAAEEAKVQERLVVDTSDAQPAGLVSTDTVRKKILGSTCPLCLTPMPCPCMTYGAVKIPQWGSGQVYYTGNSTSPNLVPSPFQIPSPYPQGQPSPHSANPTCPCTACTKYFQMVGLLALNGRTAPETPPTYEVEEVMDVVRGWRSYSVQAENALYGEEPIMRHLRLAGTYGAWWESAEMEAECLADPPEFRRILQRAGAPLSPAPSAKEHLEKGICRCGIYAFKHGPDYLEATRPTCTAVSAINVVAQCVLSGVIIEGERGYRAEKARIEQMWLIVPRNCENGHSPRWSDSTWECTLEKPTVSPGDEPARLLQEHYGVPCRAISVTEFLDRLDSGRL